jgi:hypothetical protein
VTVCLEPTTLIANLIRRPPQASRSPARGTLGAASSPIQRSSRLRDCAAQSHAPCPARFHLRFGTAMLPDRQRSVAPGPRGVTRQCTLVLAHPLVLAIGSAGAR